MRWTLDAVVGHDDQVLADPDIGVVSPVSEGYFTGGSRLLLRWTDRSRTRRFDLSGEAAGTVYGPDVEGDDSDMRLISSFRTRLSSRFALDASVSGWRFRRGQASVFDFEMVRSTARLAWAPYGSWLLTTGYRHTEVGFRKRYVYAEPDRKENQHQNDAFLGLVRNLGSVGYLGAEFSYRRTISNELRSDYRGPVAVIRAGTGLPAGLILTGQVVYAHRRYYSAAAVVPIAGAFIDTVGLRKDDTWQFGLTLERVLGPQASLFVDGSLVRQESNDHFVGFDQARLSVGIRMDLLEPAERRSSGRPAQEVSPLMPVVTGQGVRFRFEAPDADSVAVVGGWNGWDPTRNPLAGPGPDGRWEAVIHVPAGIWRFAFVVDGRWVTPPAAPRYEDDGFGGRNGVLEVTPEAVEGPVTGSLHPRQRSSEEPCP